MATPLDALLRDPRLWRGTDCAGVALESIPSGFTALDEVLPGGGWPRGALTELVPKRRGIGELALLAPALAQLTRQGKFVALIAPPHLPYAPALAASGIVLSRCTLIRPGGPEDTLWAVQQALRSGAFSAVLAWLGMSGHRRLRRLQLAAEEGKAWGAVYTVCGRTSDTGSPAPLRLGLDTTAGRLEVSILKRRGGWVAPVVLDIRRALDCPSLPRLPLAGALPGRASA